MQLLGEHQLKFLRDWAEDWTGAEMKCVLSQTAFCGAVHLHGTPDNRLIADLDCTWDSPEVLSFRAHGNSLHMTVEGESALV